MSDSDRATDRRAESESPSRESQIRSARIRAILVLMGTLILGAGIYYVVESPQDMPPGGCKTSSQCSGLGRECLQAPTGAYCTHTCNRSEDCDPGAHCDVPPWENGATRTLCLHDTPTAGKN